MAAGGCSLAPMDAALVGQDVIDLVQAREADVKAGKLKVQVDGTEPKSSV